MQNDRNDVISRQAAIEAIKEDKIDLTNPNVMAVFKATGDFEKVETQVMTCDRHIEILKELPSAQPDHSGDVNGKVDLIDRQAVIDLLKQMRKDGDMVPWEGKDVFARIRKLPSA